MTTTYKTLAQFMGYYQTSKFFAGNNSILILDNGGHDVMYTDNGRPEFEINYDDGDYESYYIDHDYTFSMIKIFKKTETKDIPLFMMRYTSFTFC